MTTSTEYTEVYNTLYLQPELLADLNKLQLSNPTQHKALHLLHLLSKSSRERFNIDCHFVPCPRNYLVEVFGDRYWKFKKTLEDAGIIECDGLFSKDSGKCFYYRINPQYFVGLTLPISVTYRHKQKVSGQNQKVQKMYHQDMVNFASSLTYNHDRLRQVVLDCVDGSTVEEKREIIHYWNGSIENLKPGHFRARRNRTNNRLDSNFTNMPTEIREAIMKDNNLVNIDLSNSQFAILAMLLKKKGLRETEDTLKFYRVCQEGTLYEYILAAFADENMTRKEAKQIMFEVAFGYVNGKDTNGYKCKFAYLFPTVHAWIKQFKLNYGDAQFPIWLQRTEADIFIDGVKSVLMAEGIPHTTIHDSVMCPEEYQEAVLDVIETVFNEHHLIAKVTVDNPANTAAELSMNVA